MSSHFLAHEMFPSITVGTSVKTRASSGRFYGEEETGRTGVAAAAASLPLRVELRIRRVTRRPRGLSSTLSQKYDQ